MNEKYILKNGDFKGARVHSIPTNEIRESHHTHRKPNDTGHNEI